MLHGALVWVAQEHLPYDTGVHEVHQVDQGSGHLRAKLQMSQGLPGFFLKLPWAPEKREPVTRSLQTFSSVYPWLQLWREIYTGPPPRTLQGSITPSTGCGPQGVAPLLEPMIRA